MKATYKISLRDSTEDIIETYLSLDYLRVNMPENAHTESRLQHLYEKIMAEYLWCLFVLFHRAFAVSDKSAKMFIDDHKVMYTNAWDTSKWGDCPIPKIYIGEDFGNSAEV